MIQIASLTVRTASGYGAMFLATATTLLIYYLPNDTNPYNRLPASFYSSSDAGYNTAFNGLNYVFFGGNYTGLATQNSLFSGAQGRTMFAVYANASVGNFVSPIIGESTATPMGSDWFVLQSRITGANTGDPYLAGYGADDYDGIPPVTGRLVFSAASYSNGVESLYFAYGDPTTHIVTPTITLTANHVLNTAAGQFTMGYDLTEASENSLELGNVQVYNAALSDSAVQGEFSTLESTYGYSLTSAPEPSTYLLMAVSLGGLALMYRRQARA